MGTKLFGNCSIRCSPFAVSLIVPPVENLLTTSFEFSLFFAPALKGEKGRRRLAILSASAEALPPKATAAGGSYSAEELGDGAKQGVFCRFFR